MKELIQSLNKNKILWILILGILILPFNRVFFTNYPNFYIGKFNFFQTESILIAQIPILIGSLVILLQKLFTSKITKFQFLPYTFFIWLLILEPSFHLLVSITLLVALFQLNSNQRKLLTYTFFFTIGFQGLLGLAQLILQSDLGLKILGEPTINQNIKGIAKFSINENIILRSYGTMPHPNLLGAYLSLATLNLPYKFKNYTLIYFAGLLSSFSIAATYINSLTEAARLSIKRKQRVILVFVLSILVTLSVTGARIYQTNHQNIEERLVQIEETIKEKLTLKDVLLGYETNTQTEIKQKPWEVVPTHNIYFMTFQNYGIITFLLLIFMLIYTFKKHPINGLFLILMFFFDHFWLTLPHGQILLILTLALFQKNQDFQVKNPSAA
jgi:hypothetical protein